MRKPIRRYDIDALRVLGTLSVFVFHCMQVFNPLEHWHIEASEKNIIFGYAISFLNIWLMPFFMLLAGSSAYYALNKKTDFQFLKERIFRILIPLIFGILLLVTPQVYWERVYRGQFEGGFFEFYPHFFSGIYPSGNFSWHHLWFLVYLFAYSIIALFFFRAFRSNLGKKTIQLFACFFAKYPLSLVLFAIPAVVFRLGLSGKFPHTNAFYNDWAWHAELFYVFLCGYLLVSDARIPSQIAFLNKPSKILHYANEAAFPFYILHQTVIVGFAFMMGKMDLNLSVKFLGLMFFSLLTTLAIYECARRFAIARFVLGMKISKSPV